MTFVNQLNKQQFDDFIKKDKSYCDQRAKQVKVEKNPRKISKKIFSYVILNIDFCNLLKDF